MGSNLLAFNSYFCLPYHPQMTRLHCKLLLPVCFIMMAIITSCQDDIPLLGKDEFGNNEIIPRDSVLISGITLLSFPSNDLSGNAWDTTLYSFDSLDFTGPDIYYSIPVLDSAAPFSYFQATHFANVTTSMLPFTFNLVPPLYVPSYYKPFYLHVYDLELDTASIDSTLMDSILFVIGPDTTLTNPYVNTIQATGPNGTSVTLNLSWQ